MPFLELPSNPSPIKDWPKEPTEGPTGEEAPRTPPSPRLRHNKQLHPLHAKAITKVRTGRFGELDEHELIHLLDALDDERARAQFRESVYISTILCLAIAWFLFYGPHVLFHQPYYKDTISAMKEHDQQVILNAPPIKPMPKVAPKIDRKTMDQLQKQAREARPTPQPPAPAAPAPQPSQEQAHTTAPPVPQPLAPVPNAPKAAPSIEAPLPAAPQPKIANNAQSAHDAMQGLGRMGRSGAEFPPTAGGAGPLQGGVQILSDTQGVDFSAYIRKVVSDTKRNWEPLIPEEVEPPLLKRGQVSIRFTILPGGQIGAMTLETPSGDVALDRAAWGAITSEGQFPPLPIQFHGPQLELRFIFMYNEPIK
jgi:TonB family protein